MEKAADTQKCPKTFVHDFRLFRTAVDPFTDRIVRRVTKISPARVASGLQSTNKPVSFPGPLGRFCQDRIVYIDQSKSTVFDVYEDEIGKKRGEIVKQRISANQNAAF